jgi:uncharacterized protein
MNQTNQLSAIESLSVKPKHLTTLNQLLLTYVPQAQVWAFGSRSRGEGHECSDLDLVLRNPTHLTTPLEGFSDLKEALEASNLPFFVDMHDWARLPNSFHQQIADNYVVLRTAGSTKIKP